MELLQIFYEATLKALQEAKNDRLWFKTNLKLGKLWFDREEYGRLQRILKELNKSCQGEDGADDIKSPNTRFSSIATTEECDSVKRNLGAAVAVYGGILFWYGAWTLIDDSLVAVRPSQLVLFHARDLLIGALLLIATDVYFQVGCVDGSFAPEFWGPWLSRRLAGWPTTDRVHAKLLDRIKAAGHHRVNDPSTKEGKRMRSAFGTVRKKRNCTVAHMREWPVCERLIKLTEPLLLC